MRERIKTILSMAVVLMSVSSIRAQDIWIEIESNRPDANVYADSIWLGHASIGIFLIPGDTKTVLLTPAEADAWSIPALTRSVPGEWSRADTLRFEMIFPYYYKLESVPSSASVFLARSAERTLIGSTPFIYTTVELPSGEFVFDRAGFQSRRIAPGSALWNRHLVALEPLAESSNVRPEVSLNVDRPRKRWIDYLAIGTAVTGGILAIHYKSKANSRYARYEKTGNATARDEIHRLDVMSGVSLGAMQLGLGVFAFRLVF